MMRALLVVMLSLASACSLRSLDHLQGGAPDAAPVADVRPPVIPDAPPPPSDAAVPDAPAPADAAADAPGSPPERAASTAFLVVGDLPPSASDATIHRRLMGYGLDVVLVDDDVLAGVDLGGASVIVVSKTARANTVRGRFRTLPRPVVLSESLLYDDMGMVNGAVAGSRGVSTNATTITVEAAAGPLAAGLAGAVAVTTQPLDMTWGVPNADAIRVGAVAGEPDHLALFAYEAGARMPQLTAPARRVGLFLSEGSADRLTPAGWALFDAAVRWALGR
jgi:hypothetical protein